MQVKRLILLLLVLTASMHSSAQILKSWHGEWKGMMHLYRKGVLTDSVPVVLEIRPVSDTVLTWRTSYQSVKMPMVKDYTMKAIDVSMGHYATDEGGGLLLDTYHFDDALYSVFEVQGILLTGIYRLQHNQIQFEVTSGKMTGKVPGDVSNYAVHSLQKVILYKQ